MAKEKTAVALGFFDGIHLGHGALLEKRRKVSDVNLTLPGSQMDVARRKQDSDGENYQAEKGHDKMNSNGNFPLSHLSLF